MRTILLVTILVLFSGTAGAADDAYNRYAGGYKNFITCELTRADAENHFDGKDFSITMVNLHDVQQESGMKILMGAVKCVVEGEYKTLYAAVGLNRVQGAEKVSYYTVRKKPFSILASELYQHLYLERCPWTRYWIDID